MEKSRRNLKVVKGGRSTPAVRLALSLVHPRERIDVPVAAIVRIVAYAERQGPWPFHNPHVGVWLVASIHERIYRLTRRIVDEPMDIVVCGECISSPVVREPLGPELPIRISAWDFAEAQALADLMRKGWLKAGPRLVAGRDLLDE